VVVILVIMTPVLVRADRAFRRHEMVACQDEIEATSRSHSSCHPSRRFILPPPEHLEVFSNSLLVLFCCGRSGRSYYHPATTFTKHDLSSSNRRRASNAHVREGSRPDFFGRDCKLRNEFTGRRGKPTLQRLLQLRRCVRESGLFILRGQEAGPNGWFNVAAHRRRRVLNARVCRPATPARVGPAAERPVLHPVPSEKARACRLVLAGRGGHDLRRHSLSQDSPGRLDVHPPERRGAEGLHQGRWAALEARAADVEEQHCREGPAVRLLRPTSAQQPGFNGRSAVVDALAVMFARPSYR
jgi:hypothetical protein